MKKLGLVLLALIMAFSFIACEDSNNNHGGSKADEVTCTLAVDIQDTAKAQLVCTFPDEKIETCGVSFGGYDLYVAKDIESGNFICTLTKGGEIIEGAAVATVKDNIVTFDVDMPAEDGFDFAQVKAYSTLTSRGEDEPLTTTIYKAEEVVSK